MNLECFHNSRGKVKYALVDLHRRNGSTSEDDVAELLEDWFSSEARVKAVELEPRVMEQLVFGVGLDDDDEAFIVGRDEGGHICNHIQRAILVNIGDLKRVHQNVQPLRSELECALVDVVLLLQLVDEVER